MSWRASRGRTLAHGGGRDVPGQPGQSAPGPTAAITRSGRMMTVSAGLDPRTASACRPVAPACRRPGGRRSSRRRGPRRPARCIADPAPGPGRAGGRIRQSGVGAPCGQHGGASGQDRVQPHRRAVSGGHQRVGDQAAGPQCGGDGRAEGPPRGVLQGAGLQPRCRGGAHGLADPLAADGRGQGDPADGGGVVLATGHRPADSNRLFHQSRGVRAASLSHASSRSSGPAGEHVRELPGQVVRVA